MTLRLVASRPVYVIGGSVTKFIGAGHPDFIDKKHPDFEKKQNPNLKDYLRMSVGDALKNTKTDASLIEHSYVGNFCGELFNNQGHLGAGLAVADPAFIGKPSMRVEAACASGGLAFYSAVQSILAGSDVALAAGVEVQTTAKPRVGGDYLARAADYDRQRGIDDFTFPAIFANRKKEYLAHFKDATSRDIAAVAAKAYAAGNRNPKAHMQKRKLSVDDVENSVAFLGNESLKEFCKVGECSQVSDGGAAVIVVSEEGAKRLGVPRDQMIKVVSLGLGTGDLWTDANPWEFATARGVADKVYHAAGWKPTDIEVAEVHDCFAVAEVLVSEAIGLAKPGEGGKLAVEGISAPDGKVPINAGPWRRWGGWCAALWCGRAWWVVGWCNLARTRPLCFAMAPHHMYLSVVSPWISPSLSLSPSIPLTPQQAAVSSLSVTPWVPPASSRCTRSGRPSPVTARTSARRAAARPSTWAARTRRS